MKKLVGLVFVLLTCLVAFNTVVNAESIHDVDLIQKGQDMVKTDFSLVIPGENRNIKARLTVPKRVNKNLPQLIIIATGLASHIDRDGQKSLAKSYQKAGFATLQFNFMAHGENENKSDGKMEQVTVSSGIKDLKTVWDYAKTLSGKVNTKDIVISASSYGAIVSLIALENKLISPESMVLLAPFTWEYVKAKGLLVKWLTIYAPSLAVKIFKISVHPALARDVAKNYFDAISKKGLLGNTAVYFFVGSSDKISSSSEIKKWCKQFNSQQPADVPFVDNVQALYKIYNNVKHFKMPDNISKDMHKRSIEFIKKTHQKRLKK